MRRLLICAVLVTFCVACGGPYHGLAKPTYIAYADAICKKYQDQRLLISKDLERQSGPQQVSGIRTRVLPLRYEETKELRKLKPPREDKKQVDSIWKLVDNETNNVDKALQKDPRAALRNDPYQAATQYARTYGLQVCGPNISTT